MQSNLESHKHDLKIAADQNQNINKEIESITQQIGIKMKDVLEQKQRLEEELAEARAETERIRKRMFVGYQDIISKLKD
jgi:predicted  nucleic acid-binding Zn-ribbon protein